MEKTLGKISCALVIIGMIWTGAWAVSSKLATTSELNTFKEITDSRLEDLESMTLATFKTLQDGMNVKFLQQQLTILYDRKYRIRDEMKKNPNDGLLKQDYQQVCQEISDTEQKIMQLNNGGKK